MCSLLIVLIAYFIYAGFESNQLAQSYCNTGNKSCCAAANLTASPSPPTSRATGITPTATIASQPNPTSSSTSDSSSTPADRTSLIGGLIGGAIVLLLIILLLVFLCCRRRNKAHKNDPNPKSSADPVHPGLNAGTSAGVAAALANQRRSEDITTRRLLPSNSKDNMAENTDQRNNKRYSHVPSLSQSTKSGRGFFGWPLINRRSYQPEMAQSDISLTGSHTDQLSHNLSRTDLSPPETLPRPSVSSSTLSTPPPATFLDAEPDPALLSTSTGSKINLSEHDARLIGESFRSSLWQGIPGDGSGNGSGVGGEEGWREGTLGRQGRG